MHHHHGYTWLGSGHDLLKDGPRRPIHPDFKHSKVVPLELAHWLLKPPAFVQGTWTDPAQAADWFGTRAREHVDSFASVHDRAPEMLSAKVQGAAKAVAGGEDVVGGWYLTGQRFLSVCLVGCGPHRLRPEIGCPQRRT
ncbi:hypothetical protein [Streptomyces malaysiensis]|uniref:Uncharacterized protein n=1 Tax=Streptomyces malaysiensis subsp. samsunensis TaxID=459658 RepID=A0A9X2RQV2_STRMQ|nr:hypothetical protein [Streptomyces samsunensis]MCQ8827517.1 hypothetical protein [Streptomyces samsunensis]